MIRDAVRHFFRQQRGTAALLGRVDLIPAVPVLTEDGRRLTLLSRGLSAWGVRLVGDCRLLGQKVRVFLPGRDARDPDGLLVLILWTYPAGAGLVENGGAFLAQARWR